jgi:hypothetical protein
MFYLSIESNSRFLLIGRDFCASIVAIEGLSLRGRVTRNQSKPLGFPPVCGNPGCEWCARLGPAIFPDNRLRESILPSLDYPSLLITADSVDVISFESSSRMKNLMQAHIVAIATP